MVRAYHVVLGAYGFWLPNDPRGSWSTYVGSRKIYHFGPATKTDTRRSVAYRGHDAELRRTAKLALARPAVCFNGLQAQSIALGFADFSKKNNLTCWACAVMPEHVHLVLARHDYPVEQMANLLKGAATRRMLQDRNHPFGNQRDRRGKLPHCWAEDGWYVYLNDDTDICRAIDYTQRNPTRAGLQPQLWSVVTSFSREPKASARAWAKRSPSARG